MAFLLFTGDYSIISMSSSSSCFATVYLRYAFEKFSSLAKIRKLSIDQNSLLPFARSKKFNHSFILGDLLLACNLEDRRSFNLNMLITLSSFILITVIDVSGSWIK